MHVVFEWLKVVELPSNRKWGSSPNMFKYNKTEPFFFKFMSPILNIDFSQNFSHLTARKYKSHPGGKMLHTWKREETMVKLWMMIQHTAINCTRLYVQDMLLIALKKLLDKTLNIYLSRYILVLDRQPILFCLKYNFRFVKDLCYNHQE